VVRPLYLPPPPAPLRVSRFLARGRPALASLDGCRREVFTYPHLGGGSGSGSHLGEVRLWHVHQRGDRGSRIKGGIGVACASGLRLLLLCSIQLGRQHAYIREAAAAATPSQAIGSLQPPSSSGPGEQAAPIGPIFSYTVHASTSTSRPHPVPVLLLVCSTVCTAQLK